MVFSHENDFNIVPKGHLNSSLFIIHYSIFTKKACCSILQHALSLHISCDIGLGGIELGIHTALFHQLLVGAGFGDDAVGDGDDAARLADGGQAMGNDEAGTVFHQLVDGFLLISLCSFDKSS